MTDLELQYNLIKLIIERSPTPHRHRIFYNFRLEGFSIDHDTLIERVHDYEQMDMASFILTHGKDPFCLDHRSVYDLRSLLNEYRSKI